MKARSSRGPRCATEPAALMPCRDARLGSLISVPVPASPSSGWPRARRLFPSRRSGVTSEDDSMATHQSADASLVPTQLAPGESAITAGAPARGGMAAAGAAVHPAAALCGADYRQNIESSAPRRWNDRNTSHRSARAKPLRLDTIDRNSPEHVPEHRVTRRAGTDGATPATWRCSGAAHDLLLGAACLGRRVDRG
jgi:hypothetical protein